MQEREKEKKYMEWIRRNLARGTRDINTVSDSLHVQSLEPRLASCFTTLATDVDHFQNEFHLSFHFE
jgi:hypothetical protein